MKIIPILFASVRPDEMSQSGRAQSRMFGCLSHVAKRPVIQAIAVLCMLVLTGCTYLPRGNYFTKGIGQYTGDGNIRDVSVRGFFESRGYVIQIETFDLGSNFEQNFRLANLPIIKGTEVEILLAVEDDELREHYILAKDRLKAQLLQAAVFVAVENSHGEIITQHSSRLADMWWASPVYPYKGSWLWPESRSHRFAAQPGDTYFLRLRYSPEPNLQGKRGCVYVYSGVGGS